LTRSTGLNSIFPHLLPGLDPEEGAMPLQPPDPAATRRPLWAVAGLVLALLLAGCANGTDVIPAPAEPSPAAPAPVPVPVPVPSPSPGEQAGTEVTVVMSDFALTLPQQTFPADTYTFRAENTGRSPHTITINGPGVVNQTADGPVQPGQSTEMTVTLQPGTYEMWCPVGHHRELGMLTSITVT
jgi:hypothetical protein